MPLDPGRTVAELKELRELTGDEGGAQRVAWTKTWVVAQEWMASKLEGTGAEMEFDAARNQWWTLPGRSEQALIIGGHLDSVPNGGWLDGALNVVAGSEVFRRLAQEEDRPVTVRLVSWADEEGARFGRSLFGSSAAAGSMSDQEELRTLVDVGTREGVVERTEREMIHGVFELEDTLVREVMVPRLDMFCLDVATPTTEVTIPGLQTTPPEVQTAPPPARAAMSRRARASLAAPASASRR